MASHPSTERRIQRFDAVVFDLDGVLVDSEPAWDLATADLMLEHGAKFNDDDRRALLGVDMAAQARYLGKRLDVDPAATRIAQRLVARFEHHANGSVKVVPGILDVLRFVRQHCPVAVVTNSPRPVALKSIAILPEELRPPILVTGSEVRPKPAADGYLAACRAMGVDPSLALAVEDSPIGATAARAAGLTTFVLGQTSLKGSLGPSFGNAIPFASAEDLLDFLQAAPGTISVLG